jgi:hypothetical protein
MRARSRLEARWAIFFDVLGVRWEYEKDGYVLNSGRYLPDFWMPDLECFIEIKGSRPTTNECDLAAQLSAETDNPVYIFAGGIFAPDYTRRPPAPSSFAFLSGLADDPYLWCRCASCGKFGIQFDGRSFRMPCHRKDGPCFNKLDGDRGITFDDARIVKSFTMAAQARFEFGERGDDRFSGDRRGPESIRDVLDGMGILLPEPTTYRKPDMPLAGQVDKLKRI